MRLPTIAKNSARDSDDEIDQEMVNRLTDYAIEHGVNYFDTSPAYCKGRSEHAMGIALSRYPRDKILYRHQAFELLSRHMEPRSLYRDV